MKKNTKNDGDNANNAQMISVAAVVIAIIALFMSISTGRSVDQKIQRQMESALEQMEAGPNPNPGALTARLQKALEDVQNQAQADQIETEIRSIRVDLGRTYSDVSAETSEQVQEIQLLLQQAEQTLWSDTNAAIENLQQALERLQLLVAQE